MRRLYYFLFGWYRLAFPAERRAMILDFFLQNDIGMLFCECREEGTLGILRSDLGRLPPELGCRVVSEHGLPSLLLRLLRRPGLITGGIVGLVLFVLFSMTVWRIEVRGNERISTVEIEEGLFEAGLSVGDLTSRVDTAAVCTRFLAKNPSIAWIGIYLRGTTVSVEVREAEMVPDTDVGDGGLYNLVSSCDAVIETIRADAGRAVVARGTTVRQGDLLISGVYNTAMGLVGIAARGEVRGRVIRTFTVTQPFLVTEKVYSEGSTQEFSLNFFGKEIKLFKSAGKNGEEYDIIKRKEQLMLPGGLRLPITTVREVALPYESLEVRLDEEQAVRAAYRRMEGELTAHLADAEILREAYSGEFTDEGYVLTCEVECVIDIAAKLPYETESTGG